ncbi:MAG: GNAT family N-acetyltransferase [Pseudonocardiales bacterium]|nr:GNAT family N-acetyltransferase [Pseudonocardiales bacterium]
MIRPATCADTEAICAIYRPIVNGTAISFEELAPDAAEITRRMLARSQLPWLVADDADRVVGYAYARGIDSGPLTVGRRTPRFTLTRSTGRVALGVCSTSV